MYQLKIKGSELVVVNDAVKFTAVVPLEDSLSHEVFNYTLIVAALNSTFSLPVPGFFAADHYTGTFTDADILNQLAFLYPGRNFEIVGWMGAVPTQPTELGVNLNFQYVKVIRDADTGTEYMFTLIVPAATGSVYKSVIKIDEAHIPVTLMDNGDWNNAYFPLYGIASPFNVFLTAVQGFDLSAFTRSPGVFDSPVNNTLLYLL